MKQPAADRALLYLSSLLKAALPEQEEEELNYAGLPKWHPGTRAMGAPDNPLVSFYFLTMVQGAVHYQVTCKRQHCQEHEVDEVVLGLALLPQRDAQKAGMDLLLTLPWHGHYNCHIALEPAC